MKFKRKFVAYLLWLVVLAGLGDRKWNLQAVREFAMNSPLVVNSLADDGADSSPGDGICADSTGKCTLRMAIVEANARDGDDTITFQEGLTGTLTIGFHLQITSNIKINGPGEQLLRIDGNNQNRIFLINAEKVSLVGLTIANGQTFRDTPDFFGGGIYHNGGILNIADYPKYLAPVGLGGQVPLGFPSTFSLPRPFRIA